MLIGPLRSEDRRSFSISDWRWISAELERNERKKNNDDDADCSTVSSGVLNPDGATV
jgi:hypothetical protein